MTQAEVNQMLSQREETFRRVKEEYERLMPAMVEFLRPNVQKGAAYLDEKHAGWVDKIVPKDLKMKTTTFCICGQLFGNFYKRPDEIGDRRAYSHGFNLDEATFNSGKYASFAAQEAGWAALEALWLDEIYWRTGVKESVSD